MAALDNGLGTIFSIFKYSETSRDVLNAYASLITNKFTPLEEYFFSKFSKIAFSMFLSDIRFNNSSYGTGLEEEKIKASTTFCFNSKS